MTVLDPTGKLPGAMLLPGDGLDWLGSLARGRRRRYAPLAVVALVVAVGGTLGLLGETIGGAAALATACTLLPPALLHLLLSRGDEDGGEQGGDGGPGVPQDDPPDDTPSPGGLDWEAFDAARSDWDRRPLAVSGADG